MAVSALLGVSACGESSTAASPESAVIVLATTGGFAGVDFQYTIDGPAGVVRGDRCANFCDWEDGDILAQVTAGEVEALAQMFDTEGFLQGDDEDFGVECCDFFHHVLTFSRGTETRTVSGSSDKLPPAVQVLVLEVGRFVDDARAVPEGN